MGFVEALKTWLYADEIGLVVDDIHFTSPISFIGHSITQTLHGTASPDCLQNGQGWWFGGSGLTGIYGRHGVYGCLNMNIIDLSRSLQSRDL